MFKKCCVLLALGLLCSCSEGMPKEKKTGPIGGGMYGELTTGKQARIDQQDEMIRRQEQEIERQKREMEDLKRQRLHNESLRRYEKQ